VTGHALALEEGFATIFSLKMAKQYANYSTPIRDPRYKAAQEDVTRLWAIDPFAIKKIRALEPRLWMVTPKIVLRAAPGLDPQVAERLCSRFADS
jgi:hypothetical protein